MPLPQISPYDEYVLHLQLIEAANDHARLNCGCTARFALIPSTAISTKGGGLTLEANPEVVLVHRRTCGLHTVISAFCGQMSVRPTAAEDILRQSQSAICIHCKAFSKPGRKSAGASSGDGEDVGLHRKQDEDSVFTTPESGDPFDPFRLLSEEFLPRGLRP